MGSLDKTINFFTGLFKEDEAGPITHGIKNLHSTRGLSGDTDLLEIAQNYKKREIKPIAAGRGSRIIAFHGDDIRPDIAIDLYSEVGLDPLVQRIQGGNRFYHMHENGMILSTVSHKCGPGSKSCGPSAIWDAFQGAVPFQNITADLRNLARYKGLPSHNLLANGLRNDVLAHYLKYQGFNLDVHPDIPRDNWYDFHRADYSILNAAQEDDPHGKHLFAMLRGEPIDSHRNGGHLGEEYNILNFIATPSVENQYTEYRVWTPENDSIPRDFSIGWNPIARQSIEWDGETLAEDFEMP